MSVEFRSPRRTTALSVTPDPHLPGPVRERRLSLRQVARSSAESNTIENTPRKKIKLVGHPSSWLGPPSLGLGLSRPLSLAVARYESLTGRSVNVPEITEYIENPDEHWITNRAEQAIPYRLDEFPERDRKRRLESSGGEVMSVKRRKRSKLTEAKVSEVRKWLEARESPPVVAEEDVALS